MRERSVAANSFLQIATCSDLITRLARRARRKRNLRRILISFLKTVNPRRSSQTVSARFYHNALQGIEMKRRILSPYRKYGKFDPKLDVASARERGGVTT